MTRDSVSRALAPGATFLAAAAILGCGGSSSSSSSPASSSSSSAAPASSSTATTSASGGAAPAPPAAGKDVHVSIANYAYKPVSMRVTVGTRLTFTNHDSTAHTATSSSPPLDTGTIKPGASASVKVTEPGTYSYICQFHPFMHGTITVIS